MYRDDEQHVPHFIIDADGTVFPVPRGGADGDPPDPTPTQPAPGGGEGGDPGGGDGGNGDPPEGTPAPGDGEGEGAGEGGGESASIDVPELPGNPEAEHPLADAEEGELRDLHSRYVALYEEHRPSAGPAEVPAMEQLVERRQAIEAEITRRQAEAEAARQRLSALDETSPELPEPEPAFASASAVAAARGAQAEGDQQPPPPRPERPRVTMLASAAASAAPAGTSIDAGTIGRAIDQVKRGQPGTTILASVPAYEDMEPGSVPEPLHRTDVDRNMALIGEAVEDWRARQAGNEPTRQGTICGPFDIIREIPDDFSTEERVAPIFPSRPAGRLGYQFSQSIDLAAVLNGVALWTESDQSDVDPDDPNTWKPCIEVDCPDTATIVADAIAACLSFDNTTEMSSPETMANFNNALRALRARVKDGRVLDRIDDLSNFHTFAGMGYGALPTLIEALNRALGVATFANRLADAQYTVVIDALTVRLLTIDRANRAFGQSRESDDVLTELQNNVDGVSRVVVALDESLSGDPGLPPTPLSNTGAPLPTITGVHRVRLVEPSAGLYAETGEMHAGVARSPELLRQNRAQYFVEEYLMLAKHGPHPWVTMDVEFCDDGSRAGFATPHGCPS